ncbi:co-chaperone GroES [Sphingobacterium suaedae]|uniref:Co-chaperone GroES n=1 Tax=Sphingobacterium suaedae TaxID=1686402 RepID=A0ABW5KCU3_9SPHI
MNLTLTEDNKLKKIMIVGDRVLVKPVAGDERTESGLYLPPGVQEKEKVQRGYVMKTGPGYVLPAISDEGDDWRPREDQVRYIPLQVREGDLVLFQAGMATEINYSGGKYYIMPHQAILMLEREEEI